MAPGALRFRLDPGAQSNPHFNPFQACPKPGNRATVGRSSRPARLTWCEGREGGWRGRQQGVWRVRRGRDGTMGRPARRPPSPIHRGPHRLQGGRLPKVPANARLVKGLFADSLPPFLMELRGGSPPPRAAGGLRAGEGAANPSGAGAAGHAPGLQARFGRAGAGWAVGRGAHRRHTLSASGPNTLQRLWPVMSNPSRHRSCTSTATCTLARGTH